MDLLLLHFNVMSMDLFGHYLIELSLPVNSVILNLLFDHVLLILAFVCNTTDIRAIVEYRNLRLLYLRFAQSHLVVQIENGWP